MSQYILTVAIPTYNRPEQLKNTLCRVLPQINSESRVKLLIVDNCSQVPAADVLATVDLDIDLQRVQLVRNSCNIGASANVMRCFEMCETPWLWILGDDDLPSECAVNTIFSSIQEEPSFIYFTVPLIKKPILESAKGNHYGEDIELFMKSMDNRTDQAAFISSSVFNMKSFRPHIKDGYMSLTTGIPHLVMLYKVLNNGGRFMISSDVIADYGLQEAGTSWGVLSYVFSMPSILGIFSNDEDVRRIRSNIFDGWKLSPKRILLAVIKKYSKDGFHQVRYLFSIIKKVYAPHWHSDFRLRLRWEIAGIWSLFPNFFQKKNEAKSFSTKVIVGNEERI